MTKEFIDFVNAHKDEDTARLLLSAARYPSIDMPAAVQQIEGLRTAREKWPSLLECEDFMYPPRLNREQASSEAAASYKASVISPLTSHFSPFTVADLTGGMGIDTLAFARVAEHVDYVERDPHLCDLMRHNLAALGITNVTLHCADSLQWLQSHLSPFFFHLIYLDPARRDARGRKVAGFDDCTPNILDHLPMLRAASRTLLVKASPMIDIDLACRQLGGVSDVHVVELKGECKEVLFLVGGDAAEPLIHVGGFTFSRSEEAAAPVVLADGVGPYLYEPCPALMKAGPYRLIVQRYGVAMLDASTHLYTADRLVDGFPGRTFRVLCEVKATRKAVAEAVPEGRAHVVTRNYPVAAADLQRRLGLSEGGDRFIVAANAAGRPRCWLCCEL